MSKIGVRISPTARLQQYARSHPIETYARVSKIFQEFGAAYVHACDITRREAR
jgi:hypothetical protein